MRARWLAEFPALAASGFGRLLGENRSPLPPDAPRALPLRDVLNDPHFARLRERFLERLPELRAEWAVP